MYFIWWRMDFGEFCFLCVAPLAWVILCLGRGSMSPAIYSLQGFPGSHPQKSSTGECLDMTSVQSLSHVQLFVTPWIAPHQASLSITNSQSLPKLKSIESVMPSNHLILCHLLLPPSIFPSIKVFSNESALHIKWPKYCSFSFSISPSNEYSTDFL